MDKQSIVKSEKQKSSLTATRDSDVVRSVMPLMNLPGDHHKSGFLKALKKFNVTEAELEDGFWKAYADHFTPASGIEFRHIFKHVQEQRKQEPKPSYYKEL